MAQIPLDSSIKYKIRETSRRLAEGLQAELNDPEKFYSAWSLAQMTAASNGMIKLKPQGRTVLLVLAGLVQALDPGPYPKQERL